MATRRVKAIIEAEDRASGVFSRLGGAVKLLGGIAVTVGAVQLGRTLVRGIGAAVKAAAQQEKAEESLAQALRNTGQVVSKNLPALKAQAAALQDLTGIGDELILQNQSLLTSIGNLRGEGLERATRAALDLAAATGTETRTAFDLVAKAAAGYTGTLSRYGIIIDQTLPQSEKFSAALEIIEKQFGGSGEAALNTFTGRLGELQGRVGDLTESIGGPFKDVLESVFADALSPLVKELNQFVDSTEFRNAVLDLSLAIVDLGIAIEGALKSLEGWNKESLDFVFRANGMKQAFQFLTLATKTYAVQVDDTESVLSRLRRSLVATRAEAFKGFIPGLGGFLDVAEEFGTSAPKLAKDVELIEFSYRRLLDANETLNASLSAETFEGAFDFDFGSKVVEGAEQATEATNVLFQNIVRLGKGASGVGETLNTTFKSQAVSGAGAVSSALVNAAFGAEQAWDRFFINFLRKIAAAIAQAVVLRVIMGAISGGGTELLNAAFGSQLLSSVNPTILGTFHEGGIVPGPAGRERLVVAQAGEAILPRDVTDALLSGGGGMTVNVYAQGSFLDSRRAPSRIARAVARVAGQGQRLGVRGS